jgi:D-alanyl-D-alanine carboxypeptidase
MTDFSRDFDLLHPMLTEQLSSIARRVKTKLGDGLSIKPISGHRTPQQQFELFKKGRMAVDGHWVVKNEKTIITNKDGFENLSRHNFLPSLAVDFGLMKIVNGNDTYLGNSLSYKEIGPVVETMGFEWGGRWTSPADPGHVQVSVNRLAFQNAERGVAALWQDMLKATGHYAHAVDGYFGKRSTDALIAFSGSAERTPEAYKQLLLAFRAL